MADAPAPGGGGGGGVTLPTSGYVGESGIRWSDLGLFVFGGIVRVFVGSIAMLIARFVDGVELLIGFAGAAVRGIVAALLGGGATVLAGAGQAAVPSIRSFGPVAIVIGVAVMLLSAYVALRVFGEVTARA
ncbi:hypothetical protein [Haloglomus salinum]|uniref:hypothetical protein n=1 Tax=Haloglomus salinum TaxID=2962673 RepID=UPI0020C963FE|nr:hypothetical protein [Haloglomus salinum]